MVVLNDLGLTLEIIGFLLFLFVPIQETHNIITKSGRLQTWMNAHHKSRYALRYGGIGLIVIGLIMQYSFLNPTLEFEWFIRE